MGASIFGGGLTYSVHTYPDRPKALMSVGTVGPYVSLTWEISAADLRALATRMLDAAAELEISATGKAAL